MQRNATHLHLHLHLRVIKATADSVSFYESRGWQMTARIKDAMAGQETTALTHALKLDAA